MEKQKFNYVFSEIPNDDEGRAFIKLCRKYLHKPSYDLRLKGQYMNDEARANWRYYETGQPIDKSTHLRVYIDKKRGV
jgi:hypothetical protein|tara:strand:+ start:2801 stop:3034 length:234 start_codon:yes stop_codon:yes gene_type:complete